VVVADLGAALEAMRVDRGVVLLALGAVTGVVVAAGGLVSGRGRYATLPPDVIARVNGEPIARATYERVLAGVVADRRGPVDAAERRRILDRLVDEELLVQRAIDLGLVRGDARVRKDLTAAVIDAATRGAAGETVGDRELARFYEAHPELSERAARLRVRRIFVRVPEAGADPTAAARAADAARRLAAGEAFDGVREALGDPEIAVVPDVLLPPAKLLEYVGPTALRAAGALPAGGTTEPLRTSGGYQVLQVVDRADDARAPLGEVRTEIATAVRKSRGDAALRRYLATLRRSAAIEVGAPGS